MSHTAASRILQFDGPNDITENEDNLDDDLTEDFMVQVDGAADNDPGLGLVSAAMLFYDSLCMYVRL